MTRLGSRAGVMALVLAFAVCPLTLVACQSGPPASTGQSGDADGSRDKQRSTAEQTAETDLSLPIERYRLDRRQQARLQKARDTLMAACMRRDNVSPPDPGGPRPREASEQRRYGIMSPQTAAQRGYHPGKPGDERSGDVGRSQQLTARQQESFSRCSKSATERLGGSLGAYEVVSRIDVDSVVDAQRNPEVRKAFRQWSACMRKRGYHYSDPWEPPNDERFTGPKVSDTEIAVARADVACKRRADVVAVWHHADVAKQQSMIDEHRAKLERVKQAIDRQLRTAATVLDRTD